MLYKLINFASWSKLMISFQVPFKILQDIYFCSKYRFNLNYALVFNNFYRAFGFTLCMTMHTYPRVYYSSKILQLIPGA